MSNPPLGFGTPSGGDEPERRNDGSAFDNPFAALFGATGDISAAFQLLSHESGSVNWELARHIARQVVSAGADRSVSVADRHAVTEAMRLAELWLDPVTVIPAGTTDADAWSRAEWVEATLPTWRELCDPVAARAVEAMNGVLPEQMLQAAGPLLEILRQMGGALFGAQVGQGLGHLAGEVVSSTDVGIPLVPGGRAGMVPANVHAFGTGLGIDEEEVRLYLALREAAHQRLYAHVPWLRTHLANTLADFTQDIAVDVSRIEELVRGMDVSNMERLQDALQSGMFEPQATPGQQATLLRLETTLALVEGWVDEIVSAAAQAHLPSAAALRETVRRRRASGGPAEQTFATLVGLELRPRRLREAAALWHTLLDVRGIDGRDAVWGHPDLLPAAEDLDDPAGFASRRTDFDLSELDD